MIRNYGLRIAMSPYFAAAIYQSFPYNPSAKSIPELRDLRQFVYADMARAVYVNGEAPNQVTLQPDHITCEYVAYPEIRAIWKQLLNGCIEYGMQSAYDVHIATWESSAPSSLPKSMTLTIHTDHDAVEYKIPLVWDDGSWIDQLTSLSAWPDLIKCVELYFNTNVGMQAYTGLRQQPLPFECTDQFWKSVNDLCVPRMRLGLVKAIAKKVYGILDPSLGDESIGETRRFRVTDFWRVHYRYSGDKIILDQFGEHNMGI